MRITYLGQCGFLMEAAGTRIVTDPYLSDYVDRSFFTGETPWRRRYPAPVSLAELNPDGVLISHSHGDHLDPWTLGKYVASGGQALMACPAPECGLLEDLGVPRIVKARSDEPFPIEKAAVTPIPCAHTELHRDGAGDYRELSYFIHLDGVKLFFGGDMSLYDGLVERLEAEKPDILLLPVNGRDDARTGKGIIGNIDENEAAELAAKLGAAYIPMHWELYDINGCDKEAILAAAQRAGAHIRLMRPMETMELT
jgi:L-ascorbate metabolism protein UlaG (beta-lactamase superfamily)